LEGVGGNVFELIKHPFLKIHDINCGTPSAPFIKKGGGVFSIMLRSTMKTLLKKNLKNF